MIKNVSFALPNLSFQGTYKCRCFGYGWGDSYERSPKTDTVEIKSSKERGLPPKLKEIFDNKEFCFERPDGAGVFYGTIKEYFEDSILNYSKDEMEYLKNCGGIHSTSWENAANILENGLDFSQNYRVQGGPGTYFAGFQDMTYGKIALRGRYTGDNEELPIFKYKFYDGIMDNEEIKEIADEFTNKQEGEKSYKLTNKYCRDLLVNEMGIDILACAMGADSCYVALNDDKMEMKPYNFRYEVKDGKYKFKGYK